MTQARPIIVAILLGVIANVVVAWTCAVSSTPSSGVAVHAQSSFGHNRLAPTRTARNQYCDTCQRRLAPWRNPYVSEPAMAIDPLTGEPPGVVVDLAGWPLPSLSCLRINEQVVGGLELSGAAGNSWRALPLVPEYQGFVRNTVFYAVVVGVLMLAPRVVRRARRRRQRRCLECGYPIGASRVCSECGAASIESSAERASVPAGPRRRWRWMFAAATAVVIMCAIAGWDVVLLGAPADGAYGRAVAGSEAVMRSIELPTPLNAEQIDAMPNDEVNAALVDVARAKNRLRRADMPCQWERLTDEFVMLMKKKRRDSAP